MTMSGILNLDDLLNESMAGVQAAPNYITPESSFVNLTVHEATAKKMERKNPAPGEAKEYGIIALTYSIDKVHEQAEGTMPMAPGSLFSDQYQLSENGLPHFKARAIAIGAAAGIENAEQDIGNAKTGEVMQGIKGLSFSAVIKKVPRRDKAGAVIADAFNIRLESIGPVKD